MAGLPAFFSGKLLVAAALLLLAGSVRFAPRHYY